MLSVSAVQLKRTFTVSLTGNGEDFALQVNGSSSAVITSGQKAAFMISILPVNGSTGTVALSCTGAPQNATCDVNPGSLMLTGQNSDSATVTIATGESSSSAAVRRSGRFDLSRLGLALALVAPMGFAARRRRIFSAKTGRRTQLAFWRWGCLLMIGLLAMLVPVGCNLNVSPGKQGGGTTPPGGTSTTPSGVYALTVTGTAPGLTHSVTLTLTVE